MAETTVASSYPLPRDENLILGSLLVLAAAARGLLIWQAAMTDDQMSLTMGMGAPLWIALWVAMMVAIMFPTAAPMIMMFAHTLQEGGARTTVRTDLDFRQRVSDRLGVGRIIAYAAAVAGDELAITRCG
jgi:predicted metal-binding membrane protein